MPASTHTLSLETQQQHWKKASQNKNWTHFGELLQNDAYSSFLASQNPMLIGLFCTAYCDNQKEFAEALLKKIQLSTWCKNDEGYLEHFERTACSAYSRKKHALLIRLLETKVHSPLANAKYKNFWADAASEAVLTDDYDLLKAFLQNGLDPNTIHSRSQRPLLYQACVHQALKAIDLLLQHHADPMLVSDDGTGKSISAYGYALKYQKIVITKLLIKHQSASFFNKRHHAHKDTFLLHFIIEHAPKLLALLPIILQNGADPNLKKDDGNTALHLATLYTEIDVAKKIIEAVFLSGGNFASDNKESKTPLQLSASRKQLEDYCKQLLLRETKAKTQLKLLTENDVRPYFILLKSLVFHKTLTKNNIFRLLYWSCYGLMIQATTQNKLCHVPPEIMTIILKYYFDTLDAENDGPYKLSKLPVSKLQTLAAPQFLTIYNKHLAQQATDHLHVAHS